MRLRAAPVVVSLALVFFGGGCGGPADPEAKLRTLLEETERAVEARDLGPVKDAIAEAYRDDAGRDKRELVRYLAGIILRNQNIHLATRVQALSVDAGGERGDVTMIAALASGPIASLADLTRLRGDVYQLEFSFVDEAGVWGLSHARWRPAVPEDLFP